MTRPIDSSERRRQEIYKFIVENPGLGVNDLSRKLCDYTERTHICAKGTLLQELNNLIDDGQIQKIKEGKQGFKIYSYIHEVTEDTTLASTFEIKLAELSGLFRLAKKMKNINNMEKISMINFCILDIWGVRFSAEWIYDGKT